MISNLMLKITRKIQKKSLEWLSQYHLCPPVIEKRNNIRFNIQAILFLPIQKQLIEFFNLWPLEQWVTSIIGLVALYWVATKIYNKRLKKKFNIELSVSFRINMILSDLILNLIVGLYYMNYRETLMGQLTLKCPISYSPLIFLVELILVMYWYEKIKKVK